MVSELLKEIRDNPEVRAEARRIILTDDLLELPDVVKTLAATQQQLVELMASMNSRLDRMEARQGRMETQQGRMEARQGRMETQLERIDNDLSEFKGSVKTQLERIDNDLGELKGSVVENKATRRMRQLAPSRYGLHSPTVVAGEVAEHGPTQQFLEACRRAGAAQEQVDRLNSTDLIIRARSGTDGASTPIYVVVEVAYTLDSEDVVRADESRRILRSLIPGSGEPDAKVIAALYGVRMREDDRDAAEELDIGVFTEVLRT